MGPLVIDTDTAQDDCVAILVGLLDPAADLRAITLVAGNVSFDQQIRNAFLTMSVAGRLGEVPVYLGSRTPIQRPWVGAENVHGDGVGGMTMDFSECSPEPEDGVDALVRTGVEYSGELCVVAIGPLTNIALATLKDPDFARNVKTLYVMGGSNNGRGNITAAAEFNFYVDPEAAKLVFQAGFDVVVVPWDPVTLRQAVFSRLVLDEISEIGTELSRFFGRVTKNTLVYDESVGIAGSTHPDSLTTAIVLHPELATRIGSYHVDIEAESDLTRGYSAMSWGVHGLAPNARVVEEIDSEGFYRYIAGIVSIETRPSRAIRYPDSG